MRLEIELTEEQRIMLMRVKDAFGYSETGVFDEFIDAAEFAEMVLVHQLKAFENMIDSGEELPDLRSD